MKFSAVNPATGEVLAEYETESLRGVLDSLSSVRSGFSGWRALGVDGRAGFFRDAAKVLRRNRERYALLMSSEMGKPIKQSRAEVDKCALTCDVYAVRSAEWLAEEAGEGDGRHFVSFEPLGVVLSIMPWNFPFWQAFRFAVPAMMAGNTVLLKHSNVVPGCSLAIREVFSEAGFPDGCFRSVICGHEVIPEVIPRVDAVSLTGSVGAGVRIAELCGRNLKKCVLELGGSDPFIVLGDADVSVAARNAALGRTLNSGQSCIASKRFIVDSSLVEEFTELFVREMESLKVGDPLRDDTDVGPLATSQQLSQLVRQVDSAVSSGDRLLTGGRRTGSRGFFFEPAVVESSMESVLFGEEVFGPVAPVVSFRADDEAVRLANSSEFGLGASVWSSDDGRAASVARGLESGVVFVNSVVKSDPRMPFGGVKRSGFGRELSKYGLREFVNVKGVSIYRSSGSKNSLSE
ncbi:NAD-dependent succinate-semialdehyde dehydrogenase [Candidatus Woesearchaeota archaeon]|nr:NAD-dependent succinate-semialdehyde dehydrogenase [Candidatus Woesearchaeota archaeon]